MGPGVLRLMLEATYKDESPLESGANLEKACCGKGLDQVF